MRSELITIYRRSSPRTGRKYDSKLVEKRKLKFYLKRGYFRNLPVDPMEPAPEPEPEPIEEDPQVKRKYEDFDEFERLSIKNDKRPMMKIAQIHNTSYHTIRKIKGKT